MYLQWEYDDEAQGLIHTRDWETESLSPVLAGEGDDFERRQLAQLDTTEREIVGLESESDSHYDRQWPADPDGAQSRFQDVLEQVDDRDSTGQSVLVHQAPLSGKVGAYPVHGYADFLHLAPTSEGIDATICEVKSSATQKVHHRYQATVYEVLFESVLGESAVNADGVTAESAIVTPENDASDGLEGVTRFDTDPYRAKLELKLQAGGSFDQTILDTSVDETRNRIARRCSGCEYEPQCVTRGVERQGLELLGLQAGTQETLHRLGIRTLEDFAQLFEQPGNDADHSDFTALTPVDQELVRRVRQEADVSNLQTRSQIAQRFVSELDDDHGRDGPDFFPNQLQGAGYNLPADEHTADEIDWTADSGADYPSGGLVRVYLYVHEDFAQDRVTLLSARVENTKTGRERHVTELPDVLPTTAYEKDAEERRLFRVFFEQFADAIESVAPDWESELLAAQLGDGLTISPGEGFLHIYLYSDGHREALMNAIRRHPGAQWRRPLRTLLGLRAGIDQEMVSIVQNDFRRRWALRFPGLGLVQSAAQFQPWDGDWFDWRGERPDGSTAPLHEIFATDLFDSAVSHGQPDGTPSLDHSQRALSWTPDDERLARWVYPVRNRETDTIPAAYVWGVLDRLEPEETDNPEHTRRYEYRSDAHEQQITEEDLSLLAERFTLAVRHVERSIQHKSWFVDKEPIDLSKLSEFTFDQQSIDEACIEYQQLEYDSKQTALESYYCQPIAERIDAGSSLAFECTDVDGASGTIRGRLLTSTLDRYDPGATDGVIGGPLSVSEHDFMVLTKLGDGDGRREQVYNDDPSNIAHSPTVIVSAVDEEHGTITVNAPFTDGWPRGNEEYTAWHKAWGTGQEAQDDGFTVHVSEGDRFVVDPMIDQITQARAHEALEHAVDVPVRRWLRQVYRGDRDQIQVEGWDREPVTDYLDRMSDVSNYHRPNDEQQRFIKDVDHGIVTLQGPPGTGKTDYTVAPAVLSRVHTARQGESDQLLGAVSAVSHGAVDEALESILDLQGDCPPDGEPIELIRICSGANQGVDDDRVEHVHYNDAPDETFERLYETYLAPDAPDTQALFFAPPVSMRSFFNALLRAVDDADHDRVSDWMADGASTVFDLTVVDEASMIDLPLCLLVGSFLDGDGQFLLVGDHRQMQPIQRHDWEEEDRKPIEVHVPFLSALNFLRYLRGEDVDIEYLASDPPDLDDPDETLPVYRLRETYRLPPESACLHTDLFYERDDIELESAGPDPHLPPVEGPLSDLLDSEDRVTLVVHDEGQSQKSNPVEQALLADLLAPLADSSGEMSDISAGVVVPFRAQRRDVIDSMPASVQVDTVERFQGGQRDVMVLSMTASDRGYISGISEFLLDPNRFNVGASRMKRKLVILASAGLFEESSNDVEQFEQHEAWVKLYRAMGGLDGAYDEYSLEEIITDETWDRFLADVDGAKACSLRVYSGYPSGE
jgi:uncharacterized protein